MFVDILLSDGTPLEIKYWRQPTLLSKYKDVAKQLNVRVEKYGKAIVEFGATKGNPITGIDDPTIKLLISELRDRWELIATTDEWNTTADILIRIIE